MIKPLNSRVLLQIEKLESTASGIIIPNPDSIVEKAKVIATADNVGRVKSGDTVLFKSWALDNVVLGEEMHSFLHESDILAILQ